MGAHQIPEFLNSRLFAFPVIGLKVTLRLLIGRPMTVLNWML